MRRLKRLIRPLTNRFRFRNSSVDSTSRISRNSSLAEGVRIFGNVNIGQSSIGRYTYIGENSNVSFTSIGSFCSIAAEFKCGLGKHPINFASTYPGFYTDQTGGSTFFGNYLPFEDQSETTIGHDVWVGTRVTVLGGQRIGTGSVLAAGSVITRDVPDYAIVGGIPARIIKFRFDESIREQLLQSEWWELPFEELQKLASLIHQPEEFAIEARRLQRDQR